MDRREPDTQSDRTTLPRTPANGEGARDTTPDRVGLLDAPLESIAFDQRYLDDCAIGEGGMGEVRLFKDRQIGRGVAVKLIRPSYAKDPSALARFVREARVQGQLEHPSIVPVYDLGVSPGGVAYFTMKRIRGVTFHEIIHQQSMGDTKTAKRHGRRRLLAAFASACLAVDFAHERGVLHRDLKPTNVMVGDFGEVYVLDWGIAQVRGASVLPTHVDAPENARTAPALTQPGIVLGTLGYMAPEQLSGGELGPTADVYALGAILFELLTSRPLHPGASIESVIASFASPTRTRASSIAPDVPPELDEICACATHVDPARRYPSARALHDAVERYLDGARDEARRRELSNEHAERAKEMSKRALSSSGGAVHRSDAMRELGRALALDPSNDEALRTLVALLTSPPSVAPKEVESAMVRSEEEQMRQQGIFGAVAYGAMFLFLPLLAWAGVRDWSSLGVLFSMLGVAAVLAYRVHRAKHPTQGQVFAVFLFSTLAFAFTSHFFGPFVVTPAALAVNTTLFSINARRDVRFATIAVGAATLTALIAIEWMRGSAYVFDLSGISIHPQALAFTGTPTRLVLSLLCVAGIVSGPLALMSMRENLRRAQRENELLLWQIRALVPEEARRAVP